ncbi:dUTP diphosphatase [Enterococcus casseliflavus]|uniref:dUTP diphosphatase n=1 Tax=Enterococcus TaxID=1350 RepID=UPI000B6BBA6A|nr:hypothetical protein A5882_003585 [Enterococcus sp. 4E1_DIV0656]
MTTEATKNNSMAITAQGRLGKTFTRVYQNEEVSTITLNNTMISRGFEIARGWEDKDINIPKRATASSAGYDFEAAETVLIPNDGKSHFVPTGIKSYMNGNEFLILANRSSQGIKNKLYLPNGIGVIDSDYYNNPDNDGHIMFAFINGNDAPYEIKKGDRIGQGIFSHYLTTDNDDASGTRTGGFGSSGK